jgi:hypothetical protein
VTVAGLGLVLFSAIGIFDGVYFHLLKFQLHRHPEAAYEQRLHTVRAFLFAPIGLLLYSDNYGGWLLWLGVTFVGADFVIELLDVAAERASRRKIGGLSSGEYVVHIAATSVRMASLALILAAKPLSAWSVGSAIHLAQPYPAWLQQFALAYSALMLAGGVLYLALPTWQPGWDRIVAELGGCRRAAGQR